MDYKRLVDIIFRTHFPRQKRQNLLYQFACFEAEEFKRSGYLPEDELNIWYKEVYYELKQRIVEMPKEKDMLGWSTIKELILQIQREKRAKPNIEDEQNLEKDIQSKFIVTLEEIIEAGLNLSDDEEEKEYLKLIAETIGIDTSEMV